MSSVTDWEATNPVKENRSGLIGKAGRPLRRPAEGHRHGGLRL